MKSIEARPVTNNVRPSPSA